MNDIDLDTLWWRTCAGDRRSFGDWVGRVERPIRLSLHGWSRNVEVEVVVQETFMRMWIRAGDRGKPPLTSSNASLRFAIRMARNIAYEEWRKRRSEVATAPEDMPDSPAAPDHDPEPTLRAAILDCLEALSGKLRQVIEARLFNRNVEPDRDLAAALGMQLNTFLQNVVRARKQVHACLDGKGFPAKERAV